MSEPGLFHVVVEAIIEKDGKILLMKRSPERDHAPNEWETLSGRMQQGESFEEAVHREVLEETGLDEHSEYHWVTPEEAPSLIKDANGQRAINCFVQAHK